MRTKRLGEPRIQRTHNIKPIKQEDPLLVYLDKYHRGDLTEKQLEELRTLYE